MEPELPQETGLISGGKQRRFADGVRVPGEVNGEAVLLVIDTGAPRTTISSSMWRISERDAMSASGTTPSASDEVVVTHGVRPLKSPMEVGVAEMEEDALLGYDVLGGDDFGPVDILLSSNKIVMDGFEIPMNKVVVKAKGVASDVQIPDEAEADVARSTRVILMMTFNSYGRQIT